MISIDMLMLSKELVFRESQFLANIHRASNVYLFKTMILCMIKCVSIVVISLYNSAGNTSILNMYVLGNYRLMIIIEANVKNALLRYIGMLVLKNVNI